MNQLSESQPVFSRSAKILIIGFAQWCIMGIAVASATTSIMETIDDSEFTDFSGMDFLYDTNMLIYLMIGMLLFFTGSITMIVSGIMYIFDKRKGIQFVTPKNEPVDIKRQTIYSVIPILDMYAALKIRKFWIYSLIMMGISVAIVPLNEFEIIPQVFPENVLFQEIILIPVAIVLIRLFSRKWNNQFSESNIEEIK